MKGSSFQAIKVDEKKKPVKTMTITPDLTNKLNKYDSEEQVLIKNVFNAKYDIREHISGLSQFAATTKQSQLENFHNAAKIYNKDMS